jgi:hypothetical protein
MTVRSHPFPTTPKANKKTFPSPPPPHYQKNRWLYRGACFQKFPKLSGIKVQNVRTEVLGFFTSGKGVNTRTDNMRIHTTGSDIRTTSVGTTARSGWLEWCSHGCPKVTSTTSIIYNNSVCPSNITCAFLFDSHKDSTIFQNTFVHISFALCSMNSVHLHNVNYKAKI